MDRASLEPNLNDKGGLHNRVTAPPIRLEPFTLTESSTFLKSSQVKLTPYGIVNLIEIKFSNDSFTIPKSYAENIRRKIGTTHGLTENAYSQELVQSQITTKQLFL
ncbi:MAG: hypothetical protein ACJAQT_003171 [Akkermansiaceae bacterium]